MGHISTPLLQPRVVAELIGLSPASLRRWDEALLPRAGRKPRRYSWAEVEVLQRAVHQASGRGGTPAAFQGARRVGPLRSRRAETEAVDGGRRRARAGARTPASAARLGGMRLADGGMRQRRRGEERSVVPVALPRSARRRDGQQRH
jgi:hypothetical protein